MHLEKHEAWKATESRLNHALVDLRTGKIIARFAYPVWAKLYFRTLCNVDSGNAGRYALTEKPWPGELEPEEELHPAGKNVAAQSA